MNSLFLLICLVGLLIFFGTALIAGLLAAPWLPTWKKDIERMLDLAELKPGDQVYDLGSGDGRLLIAAGRRCPIQGVGYEISLFHYIWSRLAIWLAGQQRQIKIRFKNLYQADLGQADVVFCFLTPRAMEKIVGKYQVELKPGSRFVSYTFSFPDLVPKSVSRPTSQSIKIYLYRKD